MCIYYIDYSCNAILIETICPVKTLILTRDYCFFEFELELTIHSKFYTWVQTIFKNCIITMLMSRKRFESLAQLILEVSTTK